MKALSIDGAGLPQFTMLYLDQTGGFIDVGEPDCDEARLVEARAGHTK